MIIVGRGDCTLMKQPANIKGVGVYIGSSLMVQTKYIFFYTLAVTE